MSVADEIERLQGAKADLKTSINAKLSETNETLIDDERIDEYASFVDNIRSGGGSGGVVDAYIVGNAYGDGWLSDSAGGSPLTPQANTIYVIRTAGTYFGRTYIWNSPSYLMTSSSVPDGSITTSKLSSELQTTIDGKVNYTDLSNITTQEIDDYFSEQGE